LNKTTKEYLEAGLKIIKEHPCFFYSLEVDDGEYHHHPKECNHDKK